MEFPELGKSCGLSSCQRLDFLPVQCLHCQVVFCKDHSFPDKHNCKVPEVQPDLSLIPSAVCFLLACKGKEVEPFKCGDCGELFCVSHRHPADHNCTSLVSQEPKKVTAPTFPNVTPGSKGGRKSAQLSGQVKLMKLKQSAKGVKEIPLEERLFFSVTFQNVQHSVFVSKHWSIGKTIDSIAALVGARNANNAAGAKLELARSEKELLTVPKDTLISALVESNDVVNGDSLTLVYK